MMTASSLPMAQAPMPAGFAAFLANIGQVPTDGGESGGFDQLLAAAPVSRAPAPANGTTAIQVVQANFVQANVARASPVKGALPQGEAAPTETAVVPEAPAAKPATVEADTAATLAANLLIALNGGNSAAAPQPGKQVPAETETDTPAEAAPDLASAAAAVPVATWLAAVVASPAPNKPAKPAEAAPVAVSDAAPAAPVVAKAARDMALPVLTLAAAGIEPQAAKPAEAPSMTILFTQPGAQGAVPVANGAAPMQVAERVLDMDSDGTWIDQLARDIAATKSDSGDISFRLMPRHLGRLDVAMRMDDEGVSLKMDTHHEATATIVTAAQGKLVEELRQQGVRVSGAEVTCTPGETGRQSQGQSQGRAATPDPAHLVETATERAEPRQKTDSEARAGDRRGRFA